MNLDNILLLLLAILLLAAMLYTLLAGGERSRHGYGMMQSKQVLLRIPA